MNRGRINPIEENQVAPEAKKTLMTMSNNWADVPNLYKMIGHNPRALNGYMDFYTKLKTGIFNEKQIEAIMLAVSEVNKCDYCLSAHTAIARKLGFTEDETVMLRTGNIKDEKLRILTRLSREITSDRGHVSEEYKTPFFEAGWTEKDYLDLIGIISICTYNNMLNSSMQTPIDFPDVKRVEQYEMS